MPARHQHPSRTSSDTASHGYVLFTLHFKNVRSSVSFSSLYSIYFIDALENEQNYIAYCTAGSSALWSLPLQASCLIPLPSALPLKEFRLYMANIGTS